ncbi:MAG: carboxypeptidase-like regulatory domain-containing protein [Saprospiraceae bacterium]
MKKFLFPLAVLFSFIELNAQAIIKGVIKSEETGTPIAGVMVSIEGKKNAAVSDENGKFRLIKVSGKSAVVIFQMKDYKPLLKSVDINLKTINMGEIILAKPDLNAAGGVTESIQIINLDDTDSNDGTDEQNVASQLGASRDLFRQSTSYNWNSVRYRQRGYLNNYTEQYFNGVPFNELDDERVVFNTYGGLNDVTRLQQNYIGLEPNSFAFGDLAGSFNIDTRASKQRKGTRVSYMKTNRTYTDRIMATHSTGLLANGWAFTASASHRWAQEGYVPGTFMDAYAYLISIDKKLNNKHLFNLTFFGAPIKQGRSGPAVQEMFELSGTNYYNPYWGYQNGEKRNARVRTTHSPTAILKHDYTPNNKTTISTALSFQFEKFADGDMDWFNAADPRPDYYSKLPSSTDDEVQRQALTDLLKNNEAARQINWANLYNTNRNNFVTINNATINGQTGQSTSGNRSKYALFDRRSDSREINFYSNFQHQLNDKQQVVGGLALRYFRSSDYKKLKDLLGGDFFVDIDQFAERDFPGSNLGQNDLKTPNRIIKVGDKYGYDYNIDVSNAYLWGQYSYSSNHFDVFASLKGSYNSFFRIGNTQNGRFPNNSLGNSEKPQFWNYGMKAGATYKLNGRNYFHIYGGHLTKAPNSRDAFLSPRTRNELASNLTNEKISSVEGGYNYRSPLFSAQISGYYTYFHNKLKALSFYSDEDRAFVNYVAKGVDTRHTGIEVAAEWKPFSSVEVYTAGTFCQHLYASRPVATATPDNGVLSIQSNLNGQTVYIDGYYVPNTPMMAGTFGVKYNAKRYWFVSANVNYFANRYEDINFNRRTEYAVSLDAASSEKLIKDSPLWNEILEQKKLPNAYTVNILAGKSLKYKSYFINITAGMDNVLNNQFVMSQFEQWRFNWTDKNVNTFPSRKYNAYGRNYFAMISLRF